MTQLRAIALMVFGFTAFAVMDAVGKLLAEDHHVVQVIWGRYVFALPVLLILAPPQRWPVLLRRSRPALQFARALLPMSAGLTIVLALRSMPLADATVISFVAPLLVTALSIPLLGETVGWHRWGAVVVGFLGVLIIARPGADTIQWAALLPLGTALSSALYQITTKLLSATVQSLSTLVYTIVVGFLLSTLALPFVWDAPTTEGWLLMALSGVFNVVGHYAIIRAFSGAPASTLAPFIYAQIVLAALLGYLMFDEVPDAVTWLGTAIVVASGLYVLHRERAVARLQTGPDIIQLNYGALEMLEDFEDMTIVNGAYGDEAELRGKLNGKTLSGTMKEPGWGEGKFTFTLSDDGTTFSGKWTNADGSGGEPWTGKCIPPVAG